MRDLRDVLNEELDRSLVSIAKLAARIGVDAKRLHGILGKKYRLDAEMLFRICDAVDIDPNSLWLSAYTDRKDNKDGDAQ